MPLPNHRSALIVAAGLLASGASFLATPAAAQDRDYAHGQHSEHGLNHIALFVGGVSELDKGGRESDTGVSVGMEYERRISDKVGVGLMAEWGQKKLSRTAMIVLPVSFHFWRGMRVLVGPGFEFADAESGSDGEDAGEEHEEHDNEWAVRLGLSYEFELGGGWTLAPEFYADLIGSDKMSLVFGASVGHSF